MGDGETRNGKPIYSEAEIRDFERQNGVLRFSDNRWDSIAPSPSDPWREDDPCPDQPQDCASGGAEGETNG